MIHKFKIEKKSYWRYVIKHKIWLLPPFYYWEVMTKDLFFGDLTPYGVAMLCKEIAEFKLKEDAIYALHQYSQINGFTEIIVKTIDEY